MRHISKDFFGNQVLSDINFSLKKGRYWALSVREWCRKVHLMKILFAWMRSSNRWIWRGCPDAWTKVEFASPIDAVAKGFGMVHQEFSCCLILPPQRIFYSTVNA
jgi:simple sugar transport system ATP-binding protein